MKVLITGGGGFVGRNVSRCLKQLGHEVLAPTHRELDMTDLHKCMAYFNENKVESIVHTAFKGHFSAANQYQDFLDNIKMFDNLVWLDDFRPTIIIGSGAEFDRRYSIDCENEDHLFKSWPVDLYGLSKNIISRRALGHTENEEETEIHAPFILRLFGCFGPDEPDFRFIKRSISRLKEGLPIEIQKNKQMDFFFVDDVAAVIHRVISTRTETLRHANLIYQQNRDHKHTLADVGEMICKEMKVLSNIVIKEKEKDHPYTGDGWKLRGEKIKLVGLETGIRRMVQELA